MRLQIGIAAILLGIATYIYSYAPEIDLRVMIPMTIVEIMLILVTFREDES